MNGFNPFNIGLYLISSINIFDENNQFKLSHNLKANNQYILLLTTTVPNQTGNFTIIASGPDYIQFI
ncbi:hypothetical protein I4U23_022236 [Adineta vaga]|nr:hypothetical protein I4U23_022236 [Adineta vaga]